eukprot:CAMPEP_0197687342 /NCGR_PEP_ID=MMETSP1338-20131121/103845_1 /TAXON_ID=43686 ORGANISM="Pelagodinium beii, Strain RCC1491" /NCGR_SAMPLE_ID=MMETSP1338 /ASSEMBLY_ACC=CAM_ASM_000754 /LENGTH=90 /DNA_ID=CAMNT_0043269421 /DNA_START=17 /DNA_END=289 /DNA_ORIENTATION=+
MQRAAISRVAPLVRTRMAQPVRFVATHRPNMVPAGQKTLQQAGIMQGVAAPTFLKKSADSTAIPVLAGCVALGVLTILPKYWTMTWGKKD